MRVAFAKRATQRVSTSLSLTRMEQRTLARRMSAITWKRKDGADVPGLAFGEKGSPGVVCIQEWWGLDFAIKEHAQFIASKGFRVIVPDLYRGKLGVEAEEANHLMSGLDWQGAVQDVGGAGALLKEEGAPKVAVTGFCMGGALSLAAATHFPNVFSAALPFYGTPPGELADVATIKVPVLAHFGENDEMAGFSSPEDAKALKALLEKSGCEHEVVIAPGVGHAFMNSSPEGIARKEKVGQGAHNQEQVDLAWGRFFAFLAKHLR